MMACIASRLKESLSKGTQVHIFNGWGESMFWVMTMLEADVTWNTEVKVITRSAGNKAFLREFYKYVISVVLYRMHDNSP